MRVTRFLFTTSVLLLLIVSCQKELTFENGTAIGTLRRAGTGECSPSIVMGSYQKDTVLNSTNYIDIHVNLTSPGTFIVRSDTVNGYSFYRDGTIGVTGDNVVRLYGHGTPLAAGTNTFIIQFGTSICAVNVVVTGAGGGGTTPAVYTLGGSPGTCTPAMANGTYMAGTALTAANTLTVTVDVTTLGTFAIGVLPVNGIAFGASGTFTTLGPQTVVLNGTGTPASAGAFNYTVTNGTSTCTFSITTAPAGAAAVFTLGGAPAACTGFTAAGTYTAGTALTAANTVQMDVTVTTAGTYNITTTTNNGMTFSGSGTFAGTGPQLVTLTGSGIPTAAGTFNFPATGSGSTCSFSITVNSSGSAAVYTLGGAPATCTGALPGGTYTAGTAMTGSNNVVLNVTVTTIGTYSITTTTVNGIQFAGSGTFTSTGPQTVTLAATGTPSAAGTNNYPATGGGNTCTFSITVNAAANQDYFPLTQNSWWSYDVNISGAPQTDTLLKKSTNLTVYTGNTYRNFNLADNITVYDSTFFRKSGNDYYHRFTVDSFTSVYYDAAVFGEILFLKENATAGTSWTSSTFSGTESGVPTLIKYSFNIASTGGTLVVNGVTYNNVIKVEWKSLVSTNGGTTFTDDIGIESWYAKGIGLIKSNIYVIAAPANYATDNLRYYQVF